MWIIVVILLVFIWLCFDDSIIIDEIEIHSRQVESTIKIAVLADFHCGNAEEVLMHMNEIMPDVILIPGDLIDENTRLDSVHQLLHGLKKWPCFYVSGNHEYKRGRTYQSYDQMIKILEEYNIVHLENESCQIEVDGNVLWIGGIQDHCSDKKRNSDELDKEHISVACRNLKKDVFSVFLMHRPEQYKLIEEYPIDLFISGHAHGGQWRLPGINGLFAPQQGLFPKRAGGVYPLKSGTHVVSRGLAHYWFLPRLFNHREINVITIKKERAD